MIMDALGFLLAPHRDSPNTEGLGAGSSDGVPLQGMTEAVAAALRAGAA